MLFLNNQTPFPAFPHGGRGKNVSPVGEIRKGVKINKEN
jgi:hypothetical protein